jgi:dihydroorotase
MRIFAILLAAATMAGAQQYDLVLRGGHVIDPANGIDAVRDVAVKGNRIAAIAAGIPASAGAKSIDATGLYVVPGLIDLHAHVFGYDGSLPPDDSALPAGTTTIVDAGGSGWRTFDEFRRTVIAHAKTRVLASLNIVGAGMVGEPAESNVADMDPAKTAAAIAKNRDVIVGIKTAHFGKPGWDAIDRAVAAGKIANVPVMVDDKIFTNAGRTTRDKLLVHLRPGDIHTHMFNDRQLEVVSRFDGKLQPWMAEARARGVLFDLGHGAGSFLWPVASQAAAQGFWPDTISTDLHAASIVGQQSDMPNCMSKMLLLGMTLPDAVLRATVNPAKAIHRYPEIGTLGVGQIADIAVLDLANGVFAFKDAWGAKRLATKRLECAFTVRDGLVVYERGARDPDGSTEIYDLLLRTGGQDIAIVGKRIARVGKNLRAAQARLVVDVTGYDVRPGLVAAGPLPSYVAVRKGITNVGEGKPGTLIEGAPADIAVFGKRCILTIKQGVVVWDSEGLAAEDWKHAGPYTNFK